METIKLYDTTLRDGTQGEDIFFTVPEKIAIARRLDDMGIHYIEGGWPHSSPRDMEFFNLARAIDLKTARLTAFGSTRKMNASPEKDPNLIALVESGAPAVAIFGKTWDLHVVNVMGNTLEENLAMIQDSLAYLKSENREVFYDAEHFFDGFRENRDYALETLKAAVKGGADAIVLCDTNGGALPFEIESVVNDLRRILSLPESGVAEAFSRVRLGIHTHNDCGLAVANSVSAVQAGVTLVQGSINGYGERCGNADLTSLIPILSVKMGFDTVSADNMAKLRTVSRYVSEMANMTPLNSRPFVGQSAFAHKGGIHVSAIMKEPRAYEHMAPEIVGNSRRVLISDLAGKSNIEYKASEMGVALPGGADSRRILGEIKRLEQEGFQYEAAEASLQILMEKLTDQFKPIFELESFRVVVEKDRDRQCSSRALIKISVDGREEITAAEGCGPVSALDNALRKALWQFFRDLDRMQLVDFKVRVIDGREGTAARVRVLLESRDEDKIWSTIGVSEDIIEASWQALADSFQYELAKIAKSNGGLKNGRSGGDGK